MALNAFIGGSCLNYALESIGGKPINWLLADVIGFFAGEVTITAGLICWLLRASGVHAPFIH